MKKKINKKKVAIASVTAMATLSILASGFAAFGTNALEATAISETVLYTRGANLSEVDINKKCNSLLCTASDYHITDFTLIYYPSKYSEREEGWESPIKISFTTHSDGPYKYRLFWDSALEINGLDFLHNEVVFANPTNVMTSNGSNYIQLPSRFSVVFSGMYNFIVPNSSYKLPWIWINDISINEDLAQDYYSDYKNAYQTGYDNGKRDGLNEGRNEGTNALSAMSWLFGSIVNIPIIVLNGLSEFSVWGLSVIAIAVTLVFVTLIVWLVKKFI